MDDPSTCYVNATLMGSYPESANQSPSQTPTGVAKPVGEDFTHTYSLHSAPPPFFSLRNRYDVQ